MLVMLLFGFLNTFRKLPAQPPLSLPHPTIPDTFYKKKHHKHHKHHKPHPQRLVCDGSPRKEASHIHHTQTHALRLPASLSPSATYAQTSLPHSLSRFFQTPKPAHSQLSSTAPAICVMTKISIATHSNPCEDAGSVLVKSKIQNPKS